uniref:Uncharacterized protein n=1 Tax=Hyaloperonospora arabidopsidis (strain Emoy2) TaxID=559515 RepID=M4BVT2_HYAAE
MSLSSHPANPFKSNGSEREMKTPDIRPRMCSAEDEDLAVHGEEMWDEEPDTGTRRRCC